MRTWVKIGELEHRAYTKRCIILLAEAAISVTAAILAVVNAVQGDPENRVFTCVCTAVFMWAPHVLERAAKHRFSASQHAAYIVMLTGSAIIGSAFNVFNKVEWYDCLMHFVSGYAMMIFIMIPFWKTAAPFTAFPSLRFTAMRTAIRTGRADGKQPRRLYRAFAGNNNKHGIRLA